MPVVFAVMLFFLCVFTPVFLGVASAYYEYFPLPSGMEEMKRSDARDEIVVASLNVACSSGTQVTGADCAALAATKRRLQVSKILEPVCAPSTWWYRDAAINCNAFMAGFRPPNGPNSRRPKDIRPIPEEQEAEIEKAVAAICLPGISEVLPSIDCGKVERRRADHAAAIALDRLCAPSYDHKDAMIDCTVLGKGP